MFVIGLIKWTEGESHDADYNSFHLRVTEKLIAKAIYYINWKLGPLMGVIV